ncbi:hypothetical protein H4R33_006480 [Dimargaris cristalligena]|nr:hypothetical protein H4R33_006480 [Dimargaris cristalligena]
MGGSGGLGIGRRKAPTVVPAGQVPPLKMMTTQLIQTPEAKSANNAYRCLSPTVVPFPSLSLDEEARLLSALQSSSPNSEVASAFPAEFVADCSAPASDAVVPNPALTIGRRARAYSLPVAQGPPTVNNGGPVNSVGPVQAGPAAATEHPELINPSEGGTESMGPQRPGGPARALRRRSVLHSSAPNIASILTTPATGFVPGQSAPVSVDPPAFPLAPVANMGQSDINTVNSPAYLPAATATPTLTTPYLANCNTPPHLITINLNRSVSSPSNVMASPETPTRPSLFKRSSVLSRLKRNSTSPAQPAVPSIPPLDYSPHQYYSYGEFIANDIHPRFQRQQLRELHNLSKQRSAPPSPPASVPQTPSTAQLVGRTSPPRADSLGRRANRRTWHAPSAETLPVIDELASDAAAGSSPLINRARSLSNKGEYSPRSTTGLSFLDDVPSRKSSLPVGPTAGKPRRAPRKKIPFVGALSAYRRDGSRAKPTLIMTLHRLKLAVHDCIPRVALRIIDKDLPDIQYAAELYPESIKWIFLRALANRLESVALALFQRGYPGDVNESISLRAPVAFPHESQEFSSDPSSGSFSFASLTGADKRRRSSSLRRSYGPDSGISTPSGLRHTLLPSFFMVAVAFRMAALVQAMVPKANPDCIWLGVSCLQLLCLNRKALPVPAEGFSNSTLPQVTQLRTLTGEYSAEQRPILVLRHLLLHMATKTSRTMGQGQLKALCRIHAASGNSTVPSNLALEPPSLNSPNRQTVVDIDDAISTTSNYTVNEPDEEMGRIRSSLSTVSLDSDATVSTSCSIISESMVASGGVSQSLAHCEDTGFTCGHGIHEPGICVEPHPFRGPSGPEIHRRPSQLPSSDRSSRITFQVSASTCSSSSSSATICLESFTKQRHLTSVGNGNHTSNSLYDHQLLNLQDLAEKLTSDRTACLLFESAPFVPDDGPSLATGHPSGPQAFRTQYSGMPMVSGGSISPSVMESYSLLDLAVIPLGSACPGSSSIDTIFVQTLAEALDDPVLNESFQCLTLQQDLDLSLQLVKRGVSPQRQRDRQGNSPLHLAARAGHLDLVVFYLWLGLDPNKAGQNLWTPLHEAMSWGHHNVTRQLITHGALLSAANVHGHTPLQLALLFGHSVADIESMMDIHHLTKSDVANIHSIFDHVSTTLGLPNPLIVPNKTPIHSTKLLSAENGLCESTGAPYSCPSRPERNQRLGGKAFPSDHYGGTTESPYPKTSSRWSMSELGSSKAHLAEMYAQIVTRSERDPRHHQPSLVSLHEFLAGSINLEAASPTISSKWDDLNPSDVPSPRSSSFDLSPSQHQLPLTPTSPSSRRSADATWGHASSSLSTGLPFSTERIETLAAQLTVLARRSTSNPLTANGCPSDTTSSIPSEDGLLDSPEASDVMAKANLESPSSKLKKFKRWSSVELKRSLFSFL